ncbi:MAG: ORF6N domain-containing protein [Bacteroidales bacterium]|nr:ORF6N domain-containing protein [Bacteroidales bacterium]
MTKEIIEIRSKIHEIRGVQVMLDFDLAEMYQVETKRLKEAVRRNLKRFEGDDFMFELTNDEYNSLMINLRSQFASSNMRGGRRHMPFAFTEQGVAMLSSVLKSESAILVNRAIIRAFVAMRNYIMSTASISAELEAIKVKLELLERNDEENLEAINDLSEDMRQEIDTIYQAIAALSVKEPMQPEPPRPKIGFKTGVDKE